MNYRANIAFLLLGAALAGCTVGPDYHQPKMDMGTQFGELAGMTNANASQPKSAAPIAEWWKTFNDLQLERLITEALHTNYNLRIAAARIREARYQRSIIAADLFPNIDAGAGYLRSRGSKNVALSLGSGGGGGSAGGNGNSGTQTSSRSSPRAFAAQNETSQDNSGAGGSSGSGGAPLTPFGQGGLPGVTSSLYQVGFDASWEIDVFGGNQRRLEASAADLSAAVESLHDVTVTLAAEVAMNYLQLRGTQERLAIARKNLAAQNETLKLTKSRADSGLTSQADVSRAAAQVELTSATLPPLEANERRLIHALSTLVAREPTALADELIVDKQLPVIPPEVPVGLPSDLIKRRPDIRRAERQIAAATARIGSAKADLFPKFAFTGSAGLDSTSPGNLFNWESRYFLISPTVTWKIFDAGRIVSNIELQKANEQESILQYRNTILTALREVEDALVAYAEEQAHHTTLTKALAQTDDSFQLVRQQYEHGLATFLEVLDTQRNVLAVQDQLAQSEQAVTTDLVALYKALGGGWEAVKN